MDVILGSAASNGLGFGLAVSAFWFGFRHGIDWDHIAAITDITSSQEERTKSLLFGTLYALGHALVVLVLGVLAILAGDFLPDSIDNTMGRIVGVTLILLGIYVLYSLIRHGRDFRMRSRWMLIFSGVRRASRWTRQRLGTQAGGTRGGVALAEAEAEDTDVDPTLWHHGHHGRIGHHHHEKPEPDDAFMNYARGTSFGVGMIHGVGAETPTQVLIFITAAGVGGKVGGVVALLAFIVGLLTSNSLITLGSAFGFLQAGRNFAVYATVGILTAVFSLVIGTIFLTGTERILPAFFSGD